MKILSRKQAEMKKQILIKWDFSHCLAKLQFIGRFEFHKQQSVINIDEMISLIEQKIVWQQPNVTSKVPV